MFYLETIAYWANFKNCLELYQDINYKLYPMRIEYTIVNGVVVVESERLKGTKSELITSIEL